MKSNLENWFKEQRDCFDIAAPEEGHELRFLNKLKKEEKDPQKSTAIDWWKPLLSIAAVLAILFIGYTGISKDKDTDLAKVSPKMAKTKDFFTKAIEEELYKINEARTPETQILVDDALKQLDILEKDYTKLAKDLETSGEDKRVIYAMIANFQARIDLLNTVLEKIESIKEINTTNYEDNLL